MRRLTSVTLLASYILYAIAAFILIGAIRLAADPIHSKVLIYYMLGAAFASVITGLFLHLFTVIAIDVEHIRGHNTK